MLAFGKVIEAPLANAAPACDGCKSFQRPGIIEVMRTSSSRRFPVTITQLPVTRCEICRRTVAYQPGNLTKALTEHYRRAHPDVLRTAAGR